MDAHFSDEQALVPFNPDANKGLNNLPAQPHATLPPARASTPVPDWALAVPGQVTPDAPRPSFSMAAPGAMAHAPMPPMPPPPKEDDGAFVRRVRAVYMDRVLHEHDLRSLKENLNSASKPVPQWVYSMCTFLPYLAAAVFMSYSIFLVMWYGYRFSSHQESSWAIASIIGVGINGFVLDVIRIGVITVVELRKFEVRKRQKAGYFTVRRVNKDQRNSSVVNEDDIHPGQIEPRAAKQYVIYIIIK